MDITVVLEQLADIRRRIAAKPDLVYGTVTQVSPLRVRLDGDSIALTYTPACTFAGAVAVDDRVALMRKGSRYVVLGVVGTAPDTGWLFNTGIAAATGWSLSYTRLRRVGPLVYVRFRATRTGADVTVSANGDITTQTVATIDEGYRPGEDGQPLMAGSLGPLTSWTVNKDGTVYLNAVAPGATITSGTAFDGGGILLA